MSELMMDCFFFYFRCLLKMQTLLGGGKGGFPFPFARGADGPADDFSLLPSVGKRYIA